MSNKAQELLVLKNEKKLLKRERQKMKDQRRISRYVKRHVCKVLGAKPEEISRVELVEEGNHRYTDVHQQTWTVIFLDDSFLRVRREQKKEASLRYNYHIMGLDKG